MSAVICAASERTRALWLWLLRQRQLDGADPSGWVAEGLVRRWYIDQGHAAAVADADLDRVLPFDHRFEKLGRRWRGTTRGDR